MSFEQAIGHPWYERAHPDDKEKCVLIYDEAFAEKRPFELAYRGIHKDGSYRDILVKAKANFTTEGMFTGYIGSCVEVPG